MDGTCRLVFAILWPETTKLLMNRSFWSRAFDQLARRLDLDTLCSLGLRIVYEPNKRLETLISLTASMNRETALTNMADELAGYDGVDGVRLNFRSIARADDLSSFLTTGARIQPGRERLSCPDGSRIFISLPLRQSVPDLIARASHARLAMAYEYVVWPWRPERDSIRDIHYNLAALDEVPGIPRALLADQRAIAERLQSAKMLADECLVIDAARPDVLRSHAIYRALAEQVDASVYSQSGAAPLIVRLDGEPARWFAALSPPDLVAGRKAELHDLAGRATQAGEVMATMRLGWIGTWRAEDSKHSIDVALQQRAIRESGHSAERAKSVFISYARADESLMLSLVAALEARGVSCWVDRDIGAGSDWDVEIERRITNCPALVAIVTREYLASRACLKEIRYAAQLDKLLVPVVESHAQLGQGLGLMLSTAQQFRLDDPRVADKVADMLRRRGC